MAEYLCPVCGEHVSTTGSCPKGCNYAAQHTGGCSEPQEPQPIEPYQTNCEGCKRRDEYIQRLKENREFWYNQYIKQEPDVASLRALKKVFTDVFAEKEKE